MAEGEEVSLEFESFLHNNGTLYSCFSHHGNRVYVDESQVGTEPAPEKCEKVKLRVFSEKSASRVFLHQKLQPFPQEWFSQGHFITASHEVR